MDWRLEKKVRVVALVFSIMALILLWAPAESAAQSKDEIRIGFLAPLTGPMAKPGAENVNGNKLFWEQAGYKAAGRPVRVIFADTSCVPDNTISQSRRLIQVDKVHFLTGPICGHEGPAAAQVSNETGVPLVMDPAGPDISTKWNRVPTVVRTALSASQIGHPFGEYLYKELGVRNATWISQDYTWGHEVTLGAKRTFEAAGGKVAKILWTPMGTADYGPLLGAIPEGTDGVIAVVVGADRIRLFQQWFNFGFDRKYKIYGQYWLHADVLPQLDDRAIGLMSKCLTYSPGIDTPENRAFVNAYAKKYKALPSWMAETAYTSALWQKTAIEAIKGKVEDKKAFLQAIRKAKINAPRGPLRMDEYDNPIQNVYVSKIAKVNHPVLGEVLTSFPIKTYTGVSQFWTWTPKEFLAGSPYKR